MLISNTTSYIHLDLKLCQNVIHSTIQSVHTVQRILYRNLNETIVNGRIVFWNNCVYISFLHLKLHDLP